MGLALLPSVAGDGCPREEAPQHRDSGGFLQGVRRSAPSPELAPASVPEGGVCPPGDRWGGGRVFAPGGLVSVLDACASQPARPPRPSAQAGLTRRTLFPHGGWRSRPGCSVAGVRAGPYTLHGWQMPASHPVLTWPSHSACMGTDGQTDRSSYQAVDPVLRPPPPVTARLSPDHPPKAPSPAAVTRGLRRHGQSTAVSRCHAGNHPSPCLSPSPCLAPVTVTPHHARHPSPCPSTVTMPVTPHMPVTHHPSPCPSPSPSSLAMPVTCHPSPCPSPLPSPLAVPITMPVTITMPFIISQFPWVVVVA